MSTPKQQQHVLIIGAGICGLALAHGLSKAAIPFTIFEAESATAVRPREWSMSLHWALPMLQSLLPADLAARVKADAGVDPTVDYGKYPCNMVPIFDGVSGEVVKEIPLEDGVRVSRRKLRRLCMEGLSIQYDHILTKLQFNDADGTVTAIFSNGATQTGTLVVGADGTRSAVRAQMFPSHAQPTSLDIGHALLTYRYQDAEKAVLARSAHPVTSLMIHADCCVLLSLQDVPDPTKPETWLFTSIVAWTGTRKGPDSTQEERRAEVMQRVQHLQEPFRSAILDMPENVAINYNQLGYWVPPTSPQWDTRQGRVTLAGDAAHSMPPHRGQGLNNAVNDAFNLVRAITGISAEAQPEAIDRYSAEVAERGAKEVKLSVETADVLMDYSRFRGSALMQHGLEKT